MHWMWPESAGPPRGEVVLEGVEEVGLLPAVAVDEDGGLRREERSWRRRVRDGERRGPLAAAAMRDAVGDRRYVEG